MTSSIYAVCQRPRICDPDAVCRLRVSPALLEFYLVIKERPEFVAVLDEILPETVDKALMLEAVEARFEALAAWVIGTETSVRPAGATRWPLICIAMAETELTWDGRLYRFDHDGFGRALERAQRDTAEV